MSTDQYENEGWVAKIRELEANPPISEDQKKADKLKGALEAILAEAEEADAANLAPDDMGSTVDEMERIAREALK